ncbi:MAG: hypothetical protein ACI4OS_07140 [Akkermansia sp.]
MTNAKSAASAQQLGDIFSRLQWHRRGIYVTAGSEPTEVAIQYKSEQHSCFRVVVCDPLALMRWLKTHAAEQGAWMLFMSILDRKAERRSPARQELLPLDSLSPVAQRSMRPE